MKTARYLVISIFSGVVFGILDGLVHANPIAQELLLVFQPIARSSVNIPAGIAIDLMYGFVLAGIYLILYRFLRVVMYVVTAWMMFDVPQTTLFYLLLAGLGEMLVIGLIYGVFLKPEP
jgi:hypothetical protein